MSKPDPASEELDPPTLLGSARALPMRLVCDGGRIIADAVVIVSPDDPNWARPIGEGAVWTNGVVRVRRKE